VTGSSFRVGFNDLDDLLFLFLIFSLCLFLYCILDFVVLVISLQYRYTYCDPTYVRKTIFVAVQHHQKGRQKITRCNLRHYHLSSCTGNRSVLLQYTDHSVHNFTVTTTISSLRPRSDLGAIQTHPFQTHNVIPCLLPHAEASTPVHRHLVHTLSSQHRRSAERRLKKHRQGISENETSTSSNTNSKHVPQVEINSICETTLGSPTGCPQDFQLS
jgi:hypothetical protein